MLLLHRFCSDPFQSSAGSTLLRGSVCLGTRQAQTFRLLWVSHLASGFAPSWFGASCTAPAQPIDLLQGISPCNHCRAAPLLESSTSGPSQGSPHSLCLHNQGFIPSCWPLGWWEHCGSKEGPTAGLPPCTNLCATHKNLGLTVKQYKKQSQHKGNNIPVHMKEETNKFTLTKQSHPMSVYASRWYPVYQLCTPWIKK